jgi:hypothetical protein
VLRNLELNWPMSLLLHDDRPVGYAITVADVPDSQLDEVAGTELAVDA